MIRVLGAAMWFSGALFIVLTYGCTTQAPAKVWAQLENPTTEQKLRHDFLRDAKQHRNPATPEIQPSSCCGEGDAYESDDFERDSDGNLVAILTCNAADACTEHCMTEDDGEGTGVWVCRPQRPPGQRFTITREMEGSGPINRTGHGWIFVASNGKIWCYFRPFGA